MPTRSTHNSQKESRNIPTTRTHSHTAQVQDGERQLISILLDIPVESLTHVTSYLAPPSLLALSRTCRSLYEHVKDDNTWFRAFLTQVAGIAPESRLDGSKILSLRRIGKSWKEEFILRHELRQYVRWVFSHNPTTTHSPQHSTIDDAHLMTENGLLTSSIQYGVVARSFPLSGKILKGYLDVSGIGLGIGNPNVEFTPDVSACAMTSDGGSARIYWGKRNGDITSTIANRVLVAGHATLKLMKCKVEDQHQAAVQKLVLDTPSETFLSAGMDGRVKLWDSITLRCLWSSDRKLQSLVPDAFVGLAGGLSEGAIVGALKSGDIYVWMVAPTLKFSDSHTPIMLPELKIGSPVQAERQSPHLDIFTAPEFRALHLRRTSDLLISILVHYSDHPFFYQISVDSNSGKSESASFGDGSYGQVSIIEPVYALGPDESNLVLVGDQLGFVSIYVTDAKTSTDASVAPVCKFEAHTDGAVSAIAWSAVVFATGSVRGTTIIWDTITLERLREFPSPMLRPAPDREWDSWGHDLETQTDLLSSYYNRLLTSFEEQYELQKDISESFEQFEYEKDYANRLIGREREQRLALDALGLSESEAVQYLLILSRDESESRQQSTGVGEEVYEGDFDDLLGSATSSQLQSSFASCPVLSSPGLNYMKELQASPLFVPEPMETGMSHLALTVQHSGSSEAM
ncbi:hypothetical protein ID866_3991, partial [Astraeus odoratus]